MDLENIIRLIDTVSGSSLDSFTLEEGNFKLSLTNGKAADGENPEGKAGKDPAEGLSKDFAGNGTVGKEAQSAAGSLAPAEEPAGRIVKSPLVGTFYASSGPEAENYVSVGDQVKKGQILGIVEAMKLMNEIESDYDGVVKAIYVENEQAVEYGQPMFLIG